jgi:hypothetical protein
MAAERWFGFTGVAAAEDSCTSPDSAPAAGGLRECLSSQLGRGKGVQVHHTALTTLPAHLLCDPHAFVALHIGAAPIYHP